MSCLLPGPGLCLVNRDGTRLIVIAHCCCCCCCPGLVRHSPALQLHGPPCLAVGLIAPRNSPAGAVIGALPLMLGQEFALEFGPTALGSEEGVHFESAGRGGRRKRSVRRLERHPRTWQHLTHTWYTVVGLFW